MVGPLYPLFSHRAAFREADAHALMFLRGVVYTVVYYVASVLGALWGWQGTSSPWGASTHGRR